MSPLILRTLGGLQIECDNRRLDNSNPSKTIALLIYLAAESGKLHQRSHLAGLFWPERSEATARTYLRQALAALRDILSDRDRTRPFLQSTRQTIELNPACELWLDAHELTSIASGVSIAGVHSMTEACAARGSCAAHTL